MKVEKVEEEKLEDEISSPWHHTAACHLPLVPSVAEASFSRDPWWQHSLKGFRHIKASTSP
jgi:hypothetical protein